MIKAISILAIGALAAFSAGCSSTRQSVSATGERYSWKKNIVTTVFWIGEQPSGNNPTPNHISSWDKNWSRSYGGFDDPNPAHRSNYIPVKFTPRQNPFYCALPYNDKATTGHRPEAPRVVPWFKEPRNGKNLRARSRTSTFLSQTLKTMACYKLKTFDQIKTGYVKPNTIELRSTNFERSATSMKAHEA